MVSETVRDFLALADEVAARDGNLTNTDSVKGEMPGASIASQTDSAQARLSLNLRSGGLLEERAATPATPTGGGPAFKTKEATD